MSLHARKEIVASGRDFASGLLLEIVEGLREVEPGGYLAIVVASRVDDDLERWARFTGNAVIESAEDARGRRYVVRKGAPPGEAEAEVPIGSRVWLYTNFDCNLACDYCCVRSSPRASRRALGLPFVQRLATEAAAASVRDLFVTGGEPFLLEEIGPILQACAAAARVTVLTNGMLFDGRRGEVLATLPKERVALQISLDSPEPALHDRHRGEGTWAKAWRGVQTARAAGFRVRVAATVTDAARELEMHAFLEREGFPPDDRVVRRVARRGAAEEGVALSRADLFPEITVTAGGYYWHPVGATDDDLFVLPPEATLRSAIDTVKLLFDEERRFARTLASVFHCA